jgi:hypothetical protein
MSGSLGNVFVLESLFCVGTLCGGTCAFFFGDGIEFVQSGGINKIYKSKTSELFAGPSGRAV